MAPLVKICGITDIEAVAAALAASVDMVGFVFFERSPRHLSHAAAAALCRAVGSGARRVALTVDADDAMLDALVAHVPLDMLQLHGRETPARVVAVRSRYGLPVMRALTLGGEDDASTIAAFDDAADFLLFDAPAGAGDARPGGNGQTFDWSLLRGIRTRSPWLLAGGLHAGNVATALAATGAAGVDVSSGVEKAPGVKDPVAIAAFVEAARRGVGATKDRADRGVGRPGAVSTAGSTHG